MAKKVKKTNSKNSILKKEISTLHSLVIVLYILLGILFAAIIAAGII
jgi:hypothetical protein